MHYIVKLLNRLHGRAIVIVYERNQRALQSSKGNTLSRES